MSDTGQAAGEPRRHRTQSRSPAGVTARQAAGLFCASPFDSLEAFRTCFWSPAFRISRPRWLLLALASVPPPCVPVQALLRPPSLSLRPTQPQRTAPPRRGPGPAPAPPARVPVSGPVPPHPRPCVRPRPVPVLVPVPVSGPVPPRPRPRVRPGPAPSRSARGRRSRARAGCGHSPARDIGGTP
ncbi:basic proline-rich protein-like [Prinia subflava]|uniref:basic proline-rich protein-like n=1 Tax=Prinia subflava TaxID=208062 RepID=UPI002FDFB057